MCPSPGIDDSQQRGYVIPIGGAEEKVNNPVILQKFCQLAGGKNANILVIPTASELEDAGPRYVDLFEEMGAKACYSAINRREDCFEEEIQQMLDKCTGIFITGGNQLRLSTILGGTPVAQSIRRLNADGAPVAGTSAGAAIMPEHMIASGAMGPTPREDGATMAPGLGLTNKLLVDQHFRQRDRIGRLLSALSYNPFITGIGIDEDTAAFINADGVFEVVGSGAVTVVDPSDLHHSSMHNADRHEPITLIGLKLHILGAGARFDSINRVAYAGD